MESDLSAKTSMKEPTSDMFSRCVFDGLVDVGKGAAE